MNTFRILILLCINLLMAHCSFAWDQKAIDAFIRRIVKERSASFIAEYIPADNGKDVFELSARAGKIVLRGNNGVSIGSALNHYLKNYCNSLITWNGTRMKIPAVLPAVKGKIRKTSPYRYRYYLNYCTFNYSMAWWNWERWQKEIDWMTLNGINMPLALTGEEAIWNRVYRQMGFSKAQLDSFFCGPSYFAWFWMGNLDAWGGPLPKHWMDSHEALQKKILAAERSMGMTPVLPAFTGHVPPSFSTKFPAAKVKQTNWNSGFSDVAILDPSDPMFEVIGTKFLEEQTKTYGTDHLYSADTFNENIPPTDDSVYLNDISKKVFASMTATDPKAVWVMQGWMFHYDSSYWHPRQMQALLNAIPSDHMIILDLYSESFPLWQRNNAYYGKPWIWNMLHNFGGNTSLWGRIQPIASSPSAALHDKHSGNMTGIGLTPEAIEQNPVLYHLMLENVWRSEPVDINSWLKQYAMQRYGAASREMNEAWSILASSVYRGALSEGGPESIITGRPTLDSATRWTRTKLDYDPAQLARVWDLFLNACPFLRHSEGFRYDFVDITRQVLANYAAPLQQRFVRAFREKDIVSFRTYSRQFLQLIEDMDLLLATHGDFLLGKWLESARANGITIQEKDQYELNARNLVTLWGNKESPLHDYSCRQWSGLLKGFYLQRWKKFIDYLDLCLTRGTAPDMNKITSEIKAWEWSWVNGHEKYKTSPVGNPMDTIVRLYRKYRKQVQDSLQETSYTK